MGIGESVTRPPEIHQTKLNLGLHIDLCLIGLVSKVVFWFYIISHASFNSPSAHKICIRMDSQFWLENFFFNHNIVHIGGILLDAMIMFFFPFI